MLQLNSVPRIVEGCVIGLLHVVARHGHNLVAGCKVFRRDVLDGPVANATGVGLHFLVRVGVPFDDDFLATSSIGTVVVARDGLGVRFRGRMLRGALKRSVKSGVHGIEAFTHVCLDVLKVVQEVHLAINQLAAARRE